MRTNKTGLMGRLAPAAACVMAVTLLTGCGSLAEEEYTREELENLARLELYEAGSDELLRTIEDGETLYQYLQATEVPDADYEYEDDYEYYEYEAWGGGELKEAAESAGEAYYLVVYRYPAAKFGSKEPEKVYTVTLYRDVKIAKMTGAEGLIKVIDLPEEMLTFWYEMSEEEADFYESLLTQK